jgi:hypothetical protein
MLYPYLLTEALCRFNDLWGWLPFSGIYGMMVDGSKWRHSQAVRQRSAKSPSPVQIRVSPCVCIVPTIRIVLSTQPQINYVFTQFSLIDVT